MNKILLFVLFSSLSFASCTQQLALFNGTNLSGWYAFTEKGKKNGDAQAVFTVSDSMIRLFGENSGYLMSLQSYSNFELTLDYRWNMDDGFRHKNKVKNSGVMYNIPPDAPDLLWPRGIQFQVKDGFTGDFVLLDNVTIKVKGV